ncbi:MAG: metal-dependent transcriptional regulator [Spirochaetes bacterium]|nr:metal-dependent transcriptional regulator [Spirochaetota bacterium]
MINNMSKSLEDYLEAIYIITQSSAVARVKEISEKMDVKKPSVINAMKELTKRGLVHQEKYGYIELTKKGKQEAKHIFEKHSLLKEFLLDILGVSKKTAEEDACKIEHFLSEETFHRLNDFVQKQKENKDVHEIN